MDEYDRRDEQADQDAGTRVSRPPATVPKSVSFTRRLRSNSCRRRQLFLDGAGDGGPGRGVGGGRRAAQPEDLRAQQPHFRRDSGEDERRGVPQDGGAVPVPDEAAEEDVQALLQQPEVKTQGLFHLRSVADFLFPSPGPDGPFPSGTLTSSLRFSATPPSTSTRTVPPPTPRCSRS